VPNLSGFNRIQDNQTLRYVRKHISHLIRLGSNDRDRDFQICQILLEGKSFIEGDKDFESVLRQAQQFSVGLACETSFGNCMAAMSVRIKTGPERPRNALIQQDVHLS
jgi:hypothetical protein